MATENQDSGAGAGSAFESARKAFGETAASFTGQAESRVRDYTEQGKDRAVEALDNVAGLVGDAAAQVSEKLGDQYGGYIQQAADAVSGLATTLRDKDADELIDDARNVVRSSPTVAIAAAAAVGFLLARVVKSGLTPKSAAGLAETPVAAPRARKPAAKAPAKTATRAKTAAKPKAPAAPLADTPIADSPAMPDGTPSAV
ncbi:MULTISPECIES: hypothetical protein [unclassified Sphingomonas]|uniref:hypothetical protein n=1 Tax=unclassified Sphingomonas TaxID=196159 RepID=UPI001F4301C3|nr:MULTISPECIES: hypothetical protein [unclassified Sphingomonas]